MSSKKAESIDAWHSDVLAYYPTHSYKETYAYIREHYNVSERSLRKFLDESGIRRSFADSQLLKSVRIKQCRYPRTCVICVRTFSGRTPTVLMCDECVGDNTPGASVVRLRKYTQFRKIAARIKLFGIDQSMFDAMLVSQDHCCGLCNAFLKQPCVDHCHSTGKVRGLLCHRCNLTLGHVEKAGSYDWLMKARTWLESVQDKS